MPRVRKTPEERFWEKVAKTDTCWLWAAGKDKYGYGAFWVAGKTVKAHRFSWEMHFGAIPAIACVLHICDTPLCINPGHLFLGSNADNMADKVAKGRQARLAGEASGASILTALNVAEIRALYATGLYYQRELSVKFGVRRQHISLIVLNKHWRE